MRIAAQAGEIDRRPAADEQDDADGGRGEGRPQAARREEPDKERPREQLRHGGEGRHRRGDVALVAVPPGRSDVEQHRRAERAQADGVEDRGRQEREAVAPPVAHAQEPQREHHAREREQ